MAGGQEKWYFLKEQLQNSASRKCGLDADKELAYRQQAANLIQDMGQRLQVYPFSTNADFCVVLSSHVFKMRIYTLLNAVFINEIYIITHYISLKQ